MKIYLVRHGETVSDIEDRFGGQWQDDLHTDNGKAQIKETAQKLADKNIEFIFSSPLIRAHDTAKAISETTGCSVEVIDGLKERHCGVITGMTKTEAKQKYPEAFERHYDHSYTHPEGESYDDFYVRVTEAFKLIKKRNNKTIAIVGHGGSLKSILKFLNQPLPDKIADGGIIEVDIG